MCFVLANGTLIRLTEELHKTSSLSASRCFSKSYSVRKDHALRQKSRKPMTVLLLTTCILRCRLHRPKSTITLALPVVSATFPSLFYPQLLNKVHFPPVDLDEKVNSFLLITEVRWGMGRNLLEETEKSRQGFCPMSNPSDIFTQHPQRPSSCCVYRTNTQTPLL